MRLGFRSRLFLAALPPILLSAVAIDLVLARLAEMDHVAAARDAMDRLLAVAEPAVAEAVPRGGNSAQAIAERLGSGAGARVTLVAADGRVLGDSGVAADRVAGLPNHLDRPEVAEAFRTGTGASTRHSETVGGTLVYAARRVETSAGPVVLRFALPLSLFRSQDSQRHLVIAVVTACAGLLLVAGVWASASILARRVRRVSDAAVRMAAGDLDARVEDAGPDEVGRLGASLNALAASALEGLNRVESERRLLRAVIDAMHEGVLATDREGRVTLVNRAMTHLLGAGPDLIGARLSDQTRVPGLLAALDEALAGKASTREETLAAPRQATVLIGAAPVEGGGAVLVAHDVTERQRVEQVRRDFVANVSHELRNPVATIQAAAETLAGEPAATAEAADLIAVVHRQASRMAAIVRDLLDLARIEAGEYPLRQEDLDVAAVVNDAVDAVRDRAAARSITVEADVQAALPRLRSDAAALATVLGNLLDNAVKYTREGDRVTVRARAATDVIEIEVADTGPGIAEHHLPRLFERFYRVDPGRSREVGGTGLGLAIVRHLVQALGGDVRVRSTVGRGTVFTLTFQAPAG